MNEIPEYVKCISLYIPGHPDTVCAGELGRVYRVEAEASTDDYLVIGLHYSVSKLRFEPSTKYEYDLQQRGVLKEDTSYLIELFAKNNIL